MTEPLDLSQWRHRIFGIDPGTRTVGFALIASHKERPVVPQDFKVLEAGILRPEKDKEFSERVGLLHTTMFELIEQFQPYVCVMENVYFGKDPLAALKLGQVRGAFIAAASRCKIQTYEMASTAIKRIITGNGHADKAHVSFALKTLMGFDKGRLPYDVTDAVAIALGFGLNPPDKIRFH